MGQISDRYFDLLRRTTRTVENYVDGLPSDDDDQTVDFAYNGTSSQTSITVQLPGGEFQQTGYVFGDAPAWGDASPIAEECGCHQTEFLGLLRPLAKTRSQAGPSGMQRP